MFTVLQRLAAYEHARERCQNIKNNISLYGTPIIDGSGLCDILFHYAQHRIDSIYYSIAIKTTEAFPELWRFGPGRGFMSGYWWPRTAEGYQARIEALDDIIAQLKTQDENKTQRRMGE